MEQIKACDIVRADGEIEDRGSNPVAEEEFAKPVPAPVKKMSPKAIVDLIVEELNLDPNEKDNVLGSDRVDVAQEKRKKWISLAKKHHKAVKKYLIDHPNARVAYWLHNKADYPVEWAEAAISADSKPQRTEYASWMYVRGFSSLGWYHEQRRKP